MVEQKQTIRYQIGLYGDVMLRNSDFYPDRDAFIYSDKRVTFKEYNERSNRMVNALTIMGVKKGDVIGVISWNCIEYAEMFGIAGKGGFIIAPFNARSSAGEVEYLINDSGAGVIFASYEFADMLEGLKPRLKTVKRFIYFGGKTKNEDYEQILEAYPDTEPEVTVVDGDPFLLLYTSGTTGVPKGALYTHGQCREDILIHHIEMPIQSEDKGLLIMPYFHIGGTIWHFTFFYKGASNVIIKDFDPQKTLQVIEQEKITNICVVPTHIVALLNYPDFKKYNTKSLKRIKYVGSPMPVEVLKKAIDVWGPIFFQGYGQTEAGPDISFLKEEDHKVVYMSEEMQKRLFSCGRPSLDVRVRIVDEHDNDVLVGEVGEIIVHSRHIMKEYWNKPKETAETIKNGWLYTRDMGRYDDGYIYLVDRKNDMIISGGENIYPREVEEVLYKHPSIQECAVIGIPDPKWVEAVHAVVVLKKGIAANADELIEFCKNNIAKYKAPKSIEIVSVLPKGASGKILKKELKSKWKEKRK